MGKRSRAGNDLRGGHRSSMTALLACLMRLGESSEKENLCSVVLVPSTLAFP